MTKNRSDTVANLTKALSVAQGELNTYNVDKAGYNFKYLTLSAIYEKALPILSKNGLALSSTSNVYVKDEQCWVKVSTSLLWGDEFITNETSFPLIEVTKKTDTDIMMLGSTVSYLTRYNVQSLLSISGSDKDAEQMHKENIEENQEKITLK